MSGPEGGVVSQSRMPKGVGQPKGAEHSRRIGLYAGLAILGSWTVAEAQTRSHTGAPPASGASRPGASVSARPAAALRVTTGASYSRLTSTARRTSASSPSGAAARAGTGGYAENDPFRPYSAQARQSASAVSSTRVSEGPPMPPRVEPRAQYNYYPGMRVGQAPNANVPQMRRHCTPSRGGVLSGSLGGGR